MSDTSRKHKMKIKGWIEDRFVESILLDGKPHFLCYTKQTGSIECFEKIETKYEVFKPLETNYYGYRPYSFTTQELNYLKSKEFSKDELLEELKYVINKYIVIRELDKHLILIDILLTFCLEWISTLHYPYFVGEIESGKSTVLHLASWLCYRCHLGEDLPLADVYNFLGLDEEGAGTIAEDESQEIYRNGEKIRMYKSSYAKGSKKARIIATDSPGKRQVFYNTFCPKWFAGEKVPQDKGFLERTPIIHMMEGRPNSNIKRPSQTEIDDLNRLRNKMLFWKVKNILKGLEKIDSGLTKRDQELWEDFVSVASNTKYFDTAKKVVTYYIEQRHNTIRNSFEGRIFKLILSKLNEKLEINMQEFWSFLISDNSELPGKLDDRTLRTFYPDEFGTRMTLNSLSNLLENKFGAKKIAIYEKVKNGYSKKTFYVFNSDMIQSFISKYRIESDQESPSSGGLSRTSYQIKQRKLDAFDYVDH